VIFLEKRSAKINRRPEIVFSGEGRNLDENILIYPFC